MMQGGGRKPATSIADYSKYFPSKGNPLLKTGLSIAGGTLGAILGTLATPGAGTAVGGAIGSGLGTALGRALGGQAIGAEGGAGEIGLDALLGGAFSGFGKAGKAAKAGQAALKIGGKELGMQTAKELGEGAGKAVGKETLEKAGQKGLTGVLERTGRAGTIARTSTLPTETAQAGIADLTRRYPSYFAGSGKKKFINVDRFIADKTTEVDNLLEGITKTIPTTQIKSEFAKYSKNLAGVEKTQFDNITKTIFKPLANKTKLNAIELNGIRREINKKFPSIFTKQAKGGQFTGAEIAADDIRQILGKKIDSLGGTQVQSINKEISQALQARPEFKKLSEQVSRVQVPFTNTPLPGAETVRQTVSDIIGRTATKGAGAGGVAPLTLRNILTRQAVGQGLSEVLTGQPQQPVETGMEAGLGTDMTDMGAGTMEDTGQQAQIDSYFQGLAIQDLQQTGGKRLAAIKAAYDLFGGGKAEKKSISQQNAERKLNQANKVLGTLESQLTAAGGPQGLAGALPAGLASLPVVGGTLQPRVRAFQDLRQGAVAQLSKALGESGVLTDQDIQRALNLVPTVTDSPEQAAIKFRALRNFLSTADTSSVGTDTRFNF